jgi:Carboxypeptidase regulatory-like domain/TonB-dependent Receptor Plug Domain
LAAGACLFLFATVPVLGQASAANNEKLRPGSIRGTLTTTQENASAGLGGLTLTLTTVPPDGSPVTADTSDDGRYEFISLKPGSYLISINQPGFKPFAKSLSLNPGQSAVIDIRVEFQTVSEKVEVKEQTQAIATESASTPAETVTQQELAALPTAQEKIREVLPVTPGVVKTQDGKLSFRGADENQSLMLVNSARTGDPVSGTFSIPVPTDAVQSFAVSKTPYDAGLGSFSGGLTTVETKPPEDQWNYRLRNFIPSVLGKNGSMVGIAEATPGFDFGGPLLKHRLFFSEVFQYEMKKKTVRGLPWPYDISKRQGFNSFTTLEAILSSRHVLILTVNSFPVRQQHVDINALVPQSASNDLNQKGIAVGLSDKYQADSGAIYSVVAAYTRFDSNAHGQGLADMLITPEGWDGNFFNQWSRRGKEFQLMPSYQLAQKHWFGHHEIHVGIDLDHRSYAGTSTSDSVQLLRQDASLAEAIHFQGAPLQNASDAAVAEFFQDHWVLNSHWALDGGARFSSETSGWSAAFAPRIGVAFSPGDEGKTVLRAGAGLFYGALPLLAADFADNPTRVVSQFDLTGQPIGLPVSYTNAYVGEVNPLSAGALPRQPGTTPRNFTWNGEVDRELRKNVLLRVSYIDSHTTYLFVINPFTGLPGAESFLGLTNTGSSHYRELSGTVRLNIRAHDEVNASYIHSETRGDLNNLSSVLIPFAQPVIRPNVYGILPYDVPNRVVTWGIFSLPKEFKFSPLADMHSGYPYSNIDVQQNYVGTPNGERFATYFSLDVKFYREFRIPFLGSSHGKMHHVRLGFYSLNVTNHGNFNAVYNNVTASNFGRFVGFLDRRDGAMIDFVD